MLKKNDLIDYFYKGIKNKNDLRIGVEHEKFVLKKDSLRQLSYDCLLYTSPSPRDRG